jgi:hypothetical protein
VGAVPSGEYASLRPDLTIPLVAIPSPVLRRLLAVHELAFDRARRRAGWVVLVAAGLLLAGQVAVVDRLREPVTSVAVAVAVCTAVRVVLLMVLERRQRDLAPRWLTARSASLRAGEFEIIRCIADDHTYDLNDAESTAELMRRSTDDARLVLEFAYPPANLERAHRRMREVHLRPVLRTGSRARVRFPAARYGLDPTGRRTFWLLGAPAVVTAAAPAGPAATRGGTGSTGRPGEAHPAGARPPGTT